MTYHNINSTGSHLSKLGEGKQCVPVVRLMVSQVSVPVECVLGANQLGSAVPALGLKSGQTCSRQASIERRRCIYRFQLGMLLIPTRLINL